MQKLLLPVFAGVKSTARVRCWHCVSWILRLFVKILTFAFVLTYAIIITNCLELVNTNFDLFSEFVLSNNRLVYVILL